MHTLLIYGASERADAALRELAAAARERGDRVTVVSLLTREPESRRCCDTRSVLWNQICSDRVRQALARAERAAGAPGTVACSSLPYPGWRGADAVVREAVARGVDEIVLPDPRVDGLGRRQRRRLRRRSPVPVSISGR